MKKTFPGILSPCLFWPLPKMFSVAFRCSRRGFEAGTGNIHPHHNGAWGRSVFLPFLKILAAAVGEACVGLSTVALSEARSASADRRGPGPLRCKVGKGLERRRGSGRDGCRFDG